MNPEHHAKHAERETSRPAEAEAERRVGGRLDASGAPRLRHASF